MKYNRIAVCKRLSKQIKTPVRIISLIQIIGVLSMIVSLITPYLYSLIVDEVMTKGKLELLFQIILAMVSVFLVSMGLSALSTYITVHYNNDMNLKVKTKAFNHLMDEDILVAVDTDAGAVQKILEQDSTVIADFFLNQIGGFFTSLLYTSIYFVLMLLINPWLSLAVIIFVPTTILVSRYIGKRFNAVQYDLWQTSSKNDNFLFNTIQRWREVKVQNLEEKLKNEYNEKLGPEREKKMTWMLFFALKGVFRQIKGMFVNNILMYCIGGFLIMEGQLTVGALLMFMSYMAQFSTSVDSLMTSVTDFGGNKAVFERLFTVLQDIEPKRCDVIQNNTDIVMNNISFAYQEGQSYVWSNVSLTFKSGKKYLIKGKSGEGKSTLAKLMLCMIKPNGGMIKLGDNNLDNINQESLFTTISAVMQENQFFNLTIMENLLMVAPKATMEQIDYACKMADIYEFIQTLPSGYKTVIGERGIKLSGGQKQRLALARLILYHPMITILDEATSSLDSVSESKILSNLNQLFEGRTLIVISHKPAMQIDFDEIITIDHATVTTKCLN